MELKYPNSANLFHFCKSVLDIKFGSVRVIDQDVGQILDFDPADCSHWKKGKKNIKSYAAAKSIAGHLGVDEALVFNILSGDLNVNEAMQEFNGYGPFGFSHKSIESYRKLYYRSNMDSWSSSPDQSFEGALEKQFNEILDVVTKIHTQINYLEAPLYLPEVIASFEDLQLTAYKATEKEINDCRIKFEKSNNQYVVSYPSEVRMKPHLRFKIAKAMAGYFFEKYQINIPFDLGEYNTEVYDVYANFFAATLLAPKKILQKELSKVDVSRDIITQVAENLWVSRLFVNAWVQKVMNSDSL